MFLIFATKYLRANFSSAVFFFYFLTLSIDSARQTITAPCPEALDTSCEKRTMDQQCTHCVGCQHTPIQDTPSPYQRAWHEMALDDRERTMSDVRQRVRVHTGSHWGVYDAEVHDGHLVAVRPFDQDPHPTPLIEAMTSAVYHESRIPQPMVRQGYLQHGMASDRAGRGGGLFCAGVVGPRRWT